jgi:hypothetical protein
MKTLLKISLFLNALLLVALGFSLTRYEKPSPAPVIQAASSEPVSSPQIQSAQTFQWNQLESTNDYRSYVANLRAVGCPEPTIRAIVTADFESATLFERRRLELSGTSALAVSAETTKQAIASVLDHDPVPSASDKTELTASTTNPSHAQTANVWTARQAISRASYPVVFQNAVQNDSGLTANQKAAVRRLQQQFVDAIGGPNQNASDPAYSARWQTAQQESDDVLRAQLGDQAYLSYQMQHYYSNFRQVMLNAGDGPVTINPDSLAK